MLLRTVQQQNDLIILGRELFDCLGNAEENLFHEFGIRPSTFCADHANVVAQFRIRGGYIGDFQNVSVPQNVLGQPLLQVQILANQCHL